MWAVSSVIAATRSRGTDASEPSAVRPVAFTVNSLPTRSDVTARQHCGWFRYAGESTLAQADGVAAAIVVAALLVAGISLLLTRDEARRSYGAADVKSALEAVRLSLTNAVIRVNP